MNEGARLDQVLQAVSLPKELLEKPYLRPVYDEPEFVVRNVWRLYGGWFDGNPAHLKPAPEGALASELATLCGGATRLVERAQELAEAGDLRLACHLAEFAVLAAPEDRAAHGIRQLVYDQRRKTESSLMARGIYGAAARESSEIRDEAPD
jgi:alkyl sulfatase BDS1-like metallo-beta-lactamase superfamily hydrolase